MAASPKMVCPVAKGRLATAGMRITALGKSNNSRVSFSQRQAAEWLQQQRLPFTEEQQTSCRSAMLQQQQQQQQQQQHT